MWALFHFKMNYILEKACEILDGLDYENLVIVCSIPKQASKGDGICDAAKVDEEHSRDGLNMEAIIDITAKPWDLPFNVQPQSTAKPIKTRWRV